jgi:DNA-binding NtrC family response regulator
MEQDAASTPILVLEDEPSIRQFLRELLTSKGYPVRVASNVAAAIGLIGKAEFHVALVDKNLPDGLGFEFIQAAHDAGTDCAVILMTAEPDVQSAMDAKKLGVVDYVIKPFSNIEDVLTRVERAAGMRNFRIQNREFAEKLKKKSDLTGRPG